MPAQRPLGSPLGTGVAGALKKKREQNERVPQICNLEPGRGHESEVGLSGGSQRAERDLSPNPAEWGGGATTEDIIAAPARSFKQHRSWEKKIRI